MPILQCVILTEQNQIGGPGILANCKQHRYTSAPFRSWSVFEVFKWILTSDGLEWLSTVTSLNDRWEEASYFVFVGLSSSPSLKKLKKHKVLMDHSMMVS